MKLRLTLETTKEYTNGASIGIDAAQGGGSFTSSVTNMSLAKVTNDFEFRTGTSFTDPVGPPWENGYWLRYDLKTNWATEQFTCEHASGWANTLPEGKGCWVGR